MCQKGGQRALLWGMKPLYCGGQARYLPRMRPRGWRSVGGQGVLSRALGLRFRLVGCVGSCVGSINRVARTRGVTLLCAKAVVCMYCGAGGS